MAKHNRTIAQDLLMELIMSKDNDHSRNSYILNIAIDVAKGAHKIESVDDSANEKNDDEISVMDELERYVFSMRTIDRSVSSKLALIYSYLDRIEPNLLDKGEIKNYIFFCKRSYPVWDVLEQESKNNILIAEYFFSSLQKQEKKDFILVVLELSRAIENELNVKVFNKYIDELVKREKKIDDFLAKDKLDIGLVAYTKDLVIQVEKSAFFKVRPTMTLEQMSLVLSYLNDSKIVKRSRLLQDFNYYLNKHSLDKCLLSHSFIDELTKLSHKYCVGSSFPITIKFAEAKGVIDSFPKKFDFIMKCYGSA